MIKIGTRIKHIRIGLGLRGEDLSRKLGISRSYLTLIESGKRSLPKGMVGKLAEAFELPKEVVYAWYLEQELKEVGVVDKKSHELIRGVLKMTPGEKANLLKVLKEEGIGSRRPKK